MTERPEEPHQPEPSERELEAGTASREARGRMEARREGAPGYDMAEEEAYEAEGIGEEGKEGA